MPTGRLRAGSLRDPIRPSPATVRLVLGWARAPRPPPSSPRGDCTRPAPGSPGRRPQAPERDPLGRGRPRLGRGGLPGPGADPDARRRSPRRRGPALLGGLLRAHGLRAVALRADDRAPHRPRADPPELPLGQQAARAGGGAGAAAVRHADRGHRPPGSRLPHGCVREVGPRRTPRRGPSPRTGVRHLHGVPLPEEGPRPLPALALAGRCAAAPGQSWVHALGAALRASDRPGDLGALLRRGLRGGRDARCGALVPG